jgi:hypothetical protein
MKKKKKKKLQSAVRDLYRRLPACVHASIQHWSSSDFGAKLEQQASKQLQAKKNGSVQLSCRSSTS